MSIWDLSPRPEAVAALCSTREYAPIDEVAAAVSLATEFPWSIYVETRQGLYRWSLAHNGGSYPLLRITARFLGVDHQRIFVGFRTLPSGEAVLFDERCDQRRSEGWRVLRFDGPTPSDVVEERIRFELGTGPGVSK